MRYQHKDPNVRRNLDQASFVLNDGGYRKLVKEIQLCDAKENTMVLSGNIVTDTYTGKQTAPYIGTYQTDGLICSCSYYLNYKLCRHIIFFRKQNKIPLFDIKMFHNSLRKFDFREEEDDNESSNLYEDVLVPGSPL